VHTLNLSIVLTEDCYLIKYVLHWDGKLRTVGFVTYKPKEINTFPWGVYVHTYVSSIFAMTDDLHGSKEVC